MAALTCTPSALVAAAPCLNCLSEKELKDIIVYAMRTSAGLTLQQVLQNSACYQCMSKKQMLVALTAMIANQLVAGQSVNTLRNSVACKACAGSDKMAEAAMLYLFCNYFQSLAV